MQVFVSEKCFARISSVLSYNVWSTVQPRLQDFVSEKILARYFSVSSVLYCVVQPIWHDYVFEKHFFCFFSFIICVVQTRLQDFFRKGYLSSLLVYCHSHYGTILFLKSILQDFFSFFFLILYVVQPSIKERLRHHSPTLPDNVCNTDISN